MFIFNAHLNVGLSLGMLGVQGPLEKKVVLSATFLLRLWHESSGVLPLLSDIFLPAASSRGSKTCEIKGTDSTGDQ